MLLNYLKLSFRLLTRSPFLTFINVIGLSVGFAAFFVLWPYSQNELSSDHFITDHDKIYRSFLEWKFRQPNGEWGEASGPAIPTFIAPELKTLGKVEDATRFTRQFLPGKTPIETNNIVLAVEQSGQEELVQIEKPICADDNLFDFFDLPFVAGNRSTALGRPEAVVLSQRLSKKLFPIANPIGQTLKINNALFEVTGVFKDLPNNTHLDFDLVFSNAGLRGAWDGSLFCFSYIKYNGDAKEVAKYLNEHQTLYLAGFLASHRKLAIMFQPLTDLAFVPSSIWDTSLPKSRSTLRTLAIVSVVILIMAWINYINLTIARGKTRYKEIATRKVSGALAGDLFLQFFYQSAVMNLIAVCAGLTIVQFARIPAQQFLKIYTVPWGEMGVSMYLFITTVIIAGVFITAGYPTFITLRLTTRQLLTSKAPTGRRYMTSVLTTAQYAVALILIVWISVMNGQLNFILTKDLGYDGENVISIQQPDIGLEGHGLEKMQTFLSSLETFMGEQSTSLESQVSGNIRLPGGGQTGTDVFATDHNRIPLMRLKMIAGRNFVKDEKINGIILSRYSVMRLGITSPDEAVGSFVEILPFCRSCTWEKLQIIGVFEDYRYSPFYAKEGSTEAATGRGEGFVNYSSAFIHFTPGPRRGAMYVKLNKENVQQQIAQIGNHFKKLLPGNIFKWQFLDDKVESWYVADKTIRNQITFFAVLAIIVACLGLLSMITNKLVEKTKEIGIRRILGAGFLQVTLVLLRSSFSQVLVAVFIGLPLARKISHEYLTRYTERIDLQWWHFTLPVVILLLIMLSTVAGVLIRAAKSNPVEALKYE
jgi:putative ABC transport system permease protein